MSRSAFILERLNWRPATHGWLLLPGTDRLHSFSDRAEAEMTAREREWELRRRINPFRCGGPFLHYQTSLDAARLHDWFLDAGLESPGVVPESEAWAELWDREHRTMSDSQRAAAWEALDRVRFFRVTEGHEARRMFLVAESRFEQDPLVNPYRWSENYVGSAPYMLVRQRETANELCHQLFVDQIGRQGRYVSFASQPESWERIDPDPFSGESRRLSSDELDLGQYPEYRSLDFFPSREPTPGQTVYMVLRRHWRLMHPDQPTWRWCWTESKPCGWPVAAYDSLAAADAHVARLEAEARTCPSPFRFGTPHGWGTLDAGGIFGTLTTIYPVNFTSLWEKYEAQDPAWISWWDEAVTVATPEDVKVVWSLYDNLRFYQVVEVEYRE
jgi:hypothetical protein